MKKYNPSQIEKKWQEFWEANRTFASTENSDKEKKFILVEFPFPSGEGLHMGHLRSYTAADVLARYFRMQGKEVMYPIGWDAFGLPAENYAIKNKVHPSVSTAKNIANIKKQCKRIGFSFDWDREVNTTDPDYYHWTQWLFLQFYKAGLAYEATGLINWCPADKTGLANEEVVAGKCERCGATVEQKELRQWYLKITAYADKLLQGLERLPEWPLAVKLQQANWIGKKSGAEIDFAVGDGTLNIFTTRPDTIFGATYLVLAPEHPLIDELSAKISNLEEVQDYVAAAKARPEMERTAESKQKTGVRLEGVTAINPATDTEIPVWVADYVLADYGTGAIMAVPAHDERDFAFATKFNLPIQPVIESTEALPYTGYGTVINSGELNGLSNSKAARIIGEKFGVPKTTYKLRDWVFSRQRYWGEPIPLVHCDKCGIVAVPDDQLPVKLPEVAEYEPTGTGESPLAAIDEWVNTTCPNCGGSAKRETNTMPQWAGSSWYFLRYTDPKNNQEFASTDKLKYWLPVDVYFGGMEHTTLHLLYSRFWNIFLHDQGLVPVSEPYTKRVPHGIILAENGEKMSKSKGNVVNPDELVTQHGADTVRMYELFLGPHGSQVSWSDKGIVGVARFLERVWYWVHKAERVEIDAEDVTREFNKLVKKVTEDLESFSYNTCVSSFMEFHNNVKDQPVSLDLIKRFLRLLYPFAPHIAEELNEVLGGETNMQNQAWPKFDETKLQTDTLKIVVQVNGKMRDTILVSTAATETDVQEAALGSAKVAAALAGSSPRRFIYVPGRIINLVTE